MTWRLETGAFPDSFFAGAVRRILALQRADGSIPWFDGGVFDPWNHIEAAMGLAVAGRLVEARRALDYLRTTQLADGSWWGQYGSAAAIEGERYAGSGDEKRIRDTNFAAYIATGVWHHYLLTDDRALLATFWPHVEAAISFVLAHQSEHGDIRWAARDPHTPEEDALVTASSSIYKSLECAILMAETMGTRRSDWIAARGALGEALRSKPHRFDRQWPSKANFSMDWYYPVLSGAVQGEAARARLAARWDEFVAEGHGCRCVTGQPWITVAEGCELVMALLATGQRAKAIKLYSWQHAWRDTDGAYWMGYQYEADVPWPAEKPAWTAGAVILAADALAQATPAARLFLEVRVRETAEQGQRFYHR